MWLDHVEVCSDHLAPRAEHICDLALRVLRLQAQACWYGTRVSSVGIHGLIDPEDSADVHAPSSAPASTRSHISNG
ncbi:hypothetical protein BV25DRAFT_1833521 [Artomyces pyxidatus]|uniref:Uncharacterized protein n=1 Tax=Artomyces pyxidatus TaxID=48021 RepID=A0ACB8SEC0_9AGAM|nr:hypothetical protein BV25DRAFT_1833521 [Artomyces pyxidatus]